MPIRPEMRALYPAPKVWREIRARILERAGHRCEWCKKPNGQHVNAFDRGVWWDFDRLIFRDERGRTANQPVGAGKIVRVVLTIAHLDHNPANNDEEHNLRALCQRCHLRYDAREHAKNAAARRAAKKKATAAPMLGGLYIGGKKVADVSAVSIEMADPVAFRGPMGQLRPVADGYVGEGSS